MIKKIMRGGFRRPAIDNKADTFGISKYVLFINYGHSRISWANVFDAARNKNHGTTDRSIMSGNLVRKIKLAIQKISRRVNN